MGVQKYPRSPKGRDSTFAVRFAVTMFKLGAGVVLALALLGIGATALLLVSMVEMSVPLAGTLAIFALCGVSMVIFIIASPTRY